MELELSRIFLQDLNRIVKIYRRQSTRCLSLPEAQTQLANDLEFTTFSELQEFLRRRDALKTLIIEVTGTNSPIPHFSKWLPRFLHEKCLLLKTPNLKSIDVTHFAEADIVCINVFDEDVYRSFKQNDMTTVYIGRRSPNLYPFSSEKAALIDNVIYNPQRSELSPEYAEDRIDGIVVRDGNKVWLDPYLPDVCTRQLRALFLSRSQNRKIELKDLFPGKFYEVTRPMTNDIKNSPPRYLEREFTTEISARDELNLIVNNLGGSKSLASFVISHAKSKYPLDLPFASTSQYFEDNPDEYALLLKDRTAGSEKRPMLLTIAADENAIAMKIVDNYGDLTKDFVFRAAYSKAFGPNRGLFLDEKPNSSFKKRVIGTSFLGQIRSSDGLFINIDRGRTEVIMLLGKGGCPPRDYGVRSFISTFNGW